MNEITAENYEQAMDYVKGLNSFNKYLNSKHSSFEESNPNSIMGLYNVCSGAIERIEKIFPNGIKFRSMEDRINFEDTFLESLVLMGVDLKEINPEHFYQKGNVASKIDTIRDKILY